MLWNKNISEQPIDFQIKESSNTFLQLPHLCYHGYFWGGNRLKIAPKIVHNKKKKKKKTFRELCILYIYCKEPPRVPGKLALPVWRYYSHLCYVNY